MREFIGVTHLPRISRSLKREALILDRIGIYDYKKDIDVWVKRFNQELLNELEWLSDQGLIFELDDTYIHSLPKDWEPKTALTAGLAEIVERGIRVNKQWDDLVEKDDGSQSHKQAILKIAQEGFHIKNEINDVFSRIVSVRLRELEGLDTFPLCYNERLPVGNRVISQANVIRIVLRALPIPDDTTSWEQILEYRSDPDSFGKFLALRRWMTDVAKAELPEKEIEDNLEWLVYDYERHLKLHKLKAQMGVFESIVTVGPEFLENMVKINWGKAAKLLFFLKHRKVDLMEAEMKAPGSEVAYIIKSREQFKPS